MQPWNMILLYQLPHIPILCDVNKEKIVNIWEHKIDNNANIVYFVHISRKWQYKDVLGEQ